jgi:hypothetical protein
MIAQLYFILAVLVSLFKSKIRLEAENAALRYQLIVLRRKVNGRIRLTNGDRLVFIQLSMVSIGAERSSRSSVPRRSCVGMWGRVTQPLQRRLRFKMRGCSTW